MIILKSNNNDLRAFETEKNGLDGLREIYASLEKKNDYFFKIKREHIEQYSDYNLIQTPDGIMGCKVVSYTGC